MNYLVFDIETIHDDDNFVRPEDDGFPPPHQHRIVAIGRALLTGLCTPIQVSCPVSADEGKLLNGFVASVSKHGNNATLVTWNGRRFDFPCITSRCLKHGIQLPFYYRQRDMRYRYSDRGHLDLMDAISDYGAGKALKLDDAARLCGIEGKTGCGSSVEELFADDRKELKAYCVNDVKVTSRLLSRWLRLRGDLGDVDVAKADAGWDELEGA